MKRLLFAVMSSYFSLFSTAQYMPMYNSLFVQTNTSDCYGETSFAGRNIIHVEYLNSTDSLMYFMQIKDSTIQFFLTNSVVSSMKPTIVLKEVLNGVDTVTNEINILFCKSNVGLPPFLDEEIILLRNDYKNYEFAYLYFNDLSCCLGGFMIYRNNRLTDTIPYDMNVGINSYNFLGVLDIKTFKRGSYVITDMGGRPLEKFRIER